MAIFTMYERFYYRYFKFNIEQSLRFGWDSFEFFMAEKIIIQLQNCGIDANRESETFFGLSFWLFYDIMAQNKANFQLFHCPATMRMEVLPYG